MDLSTDEQWRAVVGAEGSHEVSSRGRVRSLDRVDAAGKRRRGRLLKPSLINGTHLIVVFSRDSVRRNVLVHRLVLEAFVGPPPEGTEACHWNDIPTDNRVENLRWDTRSANSLDSVRNGTHYFARRSSCNYGHEFTEENTYRRPSGRRACRTCRSNQSKIRRAA